MNIVIVTYEFEVESGGLAYNCRRFCNMLTELGHDVTVISSHLSSDSYIHGGYDYSLNKSLAYEQKLKTDTKSLAPKSLLIAFGGGFNGYYASLLSKQCNCQLWLMFRGSDANISKWDSEKAFYLSKSLESASLVIGLSEEICRNARQLCPNIKSVVIPNVCEREKISIEDIRPDNIVIGTGATHLNEKKGVLSLIEMTHILTTSHPEISISLELVGEIDDDILVQYKDRSKTIGISDKVSFLGRKKREEFINIQRSWDFYVQASVCEGMGNSVVDSMSNGIRVILSNTGYIAEMASKSFPEIVSPSNDAQDLANTISRTLAMTNISYQYRKFYDEFFISTQKDSIVKLWSNLLNECYNNQKRTIPSGLLSVVLHDVGGDKHDSITTPVAVFGQFVDDIYHSGHRLCSMRDYLSMKDTERKYCIVCTFDDGYKGVLEHALPRLKRYGFTATIYVCTEYVGKYNNWNYKDRVKRIHLDYDELKMLIKEGWEIGSHGVSHRSLLRLSDEELITELVESKTTLEKHIGQVDSYAYPYGDYSDFIMTLVQRYYSSAMSLTQGGVYLNVDSHRIRRYYISEIYQIIN
ncbi:polysaccharide deacetylase family protein [Tannerella forsythia]|uniref:Glycosyltransferase n=1 Tax=Tannerella forsythia TaxID=28112 RepID=A0A3P1XGH8_TANFO|nr:polysaccharide deacetylase family protein [Tannerella forsythia]RRD57545.1 glycosyltransferase [Tannerella forsythia]